MIYRFRHQGGASSTVSSPERALELLRRGDVALVDASQAGPLRRLADEQERRLSEALGAGPERPEVWP